MFVLHSRRVHFITSNVASAVGPPKSRILKHFKRQVRVTRPFHPFARNFAYTNYFSTRVFPASLPSPAKHTKCVVSVANNSFIVSLTTSAKIVISSAHTFRFGFGVPLEIFILFLTFISTKRSELREAMVNAVWRNILCKPLLFPMIISSTRRWLGEIEDVPSFWVDEDADDSSRSCTKFLPNLCKGVFTFISKLLLCADLLVATALYYFYIFFPSLPFQSRPAWKNDFCTEPTQ